MRFRDESPAEHDRARAAVTEWREAHPGGTVDQLVADIGPQFHRGYTVVLRGLFFTALDQADRMRLADATEDCVERRQRFEAEHHDVAITAPPTLLDLWRATVPAGRVAGTAISATVIAWSLCDLMDKLDGIYPPEGGQSLPGRLTLAPQASALKAGQSQASAGAAFAPVTARR
jgi:hypothetical protein